MTKDEAIKQVQAEIIEDAERNFKLEVRISLDRIAQLSKELKQARTYLVDLEYVEPTFDN